MADRLYFAGSIYERRKHGRGIKECIAKAIGYDGWFMTSWNGKPVIINDGRLYVFVGKEKGFQSINWNRK